MDRIRAVKIKLKGVVQGVGFRPFIHRLALKHHLPGWALNSSEGLEIKVEGTKDSINSFIKDITLFAPPVSNIIEKQIEFAQPELLPENRKSFSIKESIYDSKNFAIMSPDIATCRKCKEELFSIDNRRYRYPFITCTECGPRFTIISNTPYDRIGTTMNRFALCPECSSEYHNIESRRYHSQSNSCEQCGPYLFLVDNTKKNIYGDPVLKTVQMLADGKIIAIKGLGGFHLACDAANSEVVTKLRKKKQRQDKPFAIMVKDIETCLRYVHVSSEERKLLESPQSPIVILRKKDIMPIASGVAPKQGHLGIMLAYTPVHHLLFNDSVDNTVHALVMTSGNISDDPIIIDNDEAQKKLSDMADYFLLNNRDIHNRCDDSVVSICNVSPLILRRSRGYAPLPIITKMELRQVLACGGELKNTFTIGKDNRLFLSRHIGDLKTASTFDYYKKTINSMKRITKIEPEIAAFDLHPRMLSTQFAYEYIKTYDIKGISIQHHHAHIASCMVDNNIANEKVIGIALDGTGYGTDDNLWGCEFIIADYVGFKRYGHLKYLPMPGGEAAIKEPIRMGVSLLYDVYGKNLSDINLDVLKKISKNRLEMLIQMIEKKVNSPLTSSCGRFFDAVASLIGIRDSVTYEAQAAIELEQIADNSITGRYDYTIVEKEGVKIIDPLHIVSGIVNDLTIGKPASSISAKFHNTVIDFSIKMCEFIRENIYLEKVALSGGVFQNRYLLSGLQKRLNNSGFTCIVHKNIPCNDGGISVGQAVIAGKG